MNIWLRSELTNEPNVTLNYTFDIIEKTFQFIEEYLNLSRESFPTKLGNELYFSRKNSFPSDCSLSDLIGVPDLILDEKASSSWGFLTFREEFLSIDFSLNSAERLQTTTKTLVEHILQIVTASLLLLHH